MYNWDTLNEGLMRCPAVQIPALMRRFIIVNLSIQEEGTAFSKEVLDEILKDYHRPDDFYGPDGIMKQLSKAPIERMMQAELTEQIGYEKNESGEKEPDNRRTRKSSKNLRTNQGPMQIEVQRDRNGEFEPKIMSLKTVVFRIFSLALLTA